MGDDVGGRRPSIATIFNPRKGRGGVTVPSRPSVVVTDEDSPGPPLQLSNGSGLRIAGSAGGVSGGCGTPVGSPSIKFGSPAPHTDAEGGSVGDSAGRDGGATSRCARFKKAILSQTTKKIVVGWMVTCSVTTSWVGATHLIKAMFLTTSQHPTFATTSTQTPAVTSTHLPTPQPQPSPPPAANSTLTPDSEELVFDAPFFTTWFCTAWTGLFFPLYLGCHACCTREHPALATMIKNIANAFRDRGVTFSQFMSRCCLFTALWVLTNYMYVYSLRILDCTDVMALYSAHVSFVYLLSWVILHDQFVGVRIVAVILCNTGIALLAYMDGINRTKTLLAVVLAAASAAGSAVYKVLFKKVVGEASFGQVSLIFTVIALLNTLLLSPILAALYFSGYEKIIWASLPWPNLLMAAALSLAANLLGNLGVAFTFELFITLGLVLAVPVSAALDIKWYHTKFEGMKLAGVVLIVCGFFLVLLPANWPEYITRALRWGRHRKRNQTRQPSEPVDYRTGLISRSHLRSPSGLIR